jgi:hypothetical protein
MQVDICDAEVMAKNKKLETFKFYKRRGAKDIYSDSIP